MAFIFVANYTQSSYEFGYALKFMRILTLILTAISTSVALQQVLFYLSVL